MSMTLTKINALDAFIKGEKTAGRWNGHKRIYFPVWGSAVANALCMKTLLSGTFVGGWTHSNQAAAANDVNGYFQPDATLPSMGMTLGNYHFTTLIRGITNFAVETNNRSSLVTVNETNSDLGVTIDLANNLDGEVTQFLAYVFLNGGLPGNTRSVQIYDYQRQPTSITMGIFSVFGNGTTGYTRSRNNAGGALYGTSASYSNNGGFGTLYTRIFNAGLANMSHPFEPQSFFSIGTYVAPADNLLFTAAVETLFETVTGLTLP
jgi:hypothetical protein